ncbi:hypothetical protein HMPREF0322_01879 [Desulfitobacterium hafniense DP7]|uniref:DUF3102 domain-containing protein n=1 Tax=Desulfitobacterium hafniense DP7 TaxID=537010 RepID=G9XLP3_DESHA|nr:DUF3102 domain-containing protein [Desulfitobacterium hafniense]EHL07528.1 hypothetical protein HMPREF0322_01879 [Desulfitobacterium hafniense DP7]
MDQELSSRTPQIIAAEINSIKEQTGKILLQSAVEIGRRLTEAKAMVDHGEWQKWLESSVSYSQSTANKLMRVFAEYGSKLTAGQQGGANSESITSLSYTQAVILLGVPEEERESFIVENDVASLSTRELQQVVQEREPAPNNTITQLTAERDDLRKQASSLKAAAGRTKPPSRPCRSSWKRLRKATHPPAKSPPWRKNLKLPGLRFPPIKLFFILTAWPNPSTNC